jgi:Zn finger protein HypA/HybF involved in hydrogenase expression
MEASTEMRQTSVYCIECLCGRYIETESAELDCPTCGRKLRIEWDAEAKVAESKPEPKTIPAAA